MNLTKIKKLTLGVGDKAKPVAGRKGVLYIDDIMPGETVNVRARQGRIIIRPRTIWEGGQLC